MTDSDKLWGGRFTERPHETFAEFNDSFRFDKRLFAADVRGCMAHARGLGRAGLISAEELDAIIADFISERTLSENLAHFDAAEVTVGPIYDAAMLMQDPHVKARGSFVEMDDAEMGTLPMHSVVGRLSATPGAIRRPAPHLDQHRAEILEELYSQRPRTS